MADRGERQRLVFGLIYRLGGTITSRDMVEAFGLTQSGAATELNRYRVQGFLRRQSEPGPGPPVYRYSLTRMGLSKARWMVSQGLLQAEQQEHLPGLEPVEPEPRVVRPVIYHRGPESGRRVVRPDIHRRGD